MPSPLTVATPAAAAPAVVQAAPGRGSAVWIILAAIGLAALGALAWALTRRRRGADPVADMAAPEVAASAAASPTAIVPPVAAAPRASLAIELRPIRAGLNLLSVTCEAEVVIRNIGDAAARDIRLEMRLTSAHAGLDDDLAAILAAPVARAAIPSFALDPREGVPVTATVALPREAIHELSATGRPMMIPVVMVALSYATGERAVQVVQAFAVGIERVDSAKLAPFWLDVAPRMHAGVAARPHAAALEREA